MCVSVAKFFSPGAGGLVEGGLDPVPDEIILNCYRLADRYHQNPAVFLNMPLSEIGLHLTFTVKLIEAKIAAHARDEEDE